MIDLARWMRLDAAHRLGKWWRRQRRLAALRRRPPMAAPERIFLSHSGLDAARATRFARRLEACLLREGIVVDVFNTSEPEHRFELAREAAVGDEGRAEADEPLRRYLATNLDRALGCIMMATPQSLAARSDWIRFELGYAMEQEEQHPGQRFFIPVWFEDASPTQGDVPDKVLHYNAVAVRDDWFDADIEPLVEALVDRVR